MLKHVLLWLSLGCTSLFAQDLPETYAAYGQLMVVPFKTAPFPHPLRAQGHQYHTTFYSAAEHYSDSSVALFIPKGFHAGGKTEFEIHFHGWGNSLTNAFRKYKLVEQFIASKRNAILVVPQGPFNASDSFGGKLEDPDGFKRFMAEVMATLKERGVIHSDKIGQIILSGHSGGYEVISSIVAWGGLSDHIREVWLFDALYGNTERFVTWFDHHKGRFIDIYTDHGGTMEESQNLMAALKNNGVPYFSSTEAAVTDKELKQNHLVFLHTELPHDEVMQHTQNYRRFLQTSALPEIRH